MDPVEKSQAYRKKNYNYAEIIGKAQSKTKEWKQAARIWRMAHKTINSTSDNMMIPRDRNIHCELTFQRKDGNPANEQTEYYQNEACDWIKIRSVSKVSQTLIPQNDANTYGKNYGHP